MYGKTLLMNAPKSEVSEEVAKHFKETLCPAVEKMAGMTGEPWWVMRENLLNKALLKSFFEGGAVVGAGVLIGSIGYALFKRKRTNDNQEAK